MATSPAAKSSPMQTEAMRANDGLQYDGDAAEDDGHPRGVKGQRQQPEDTDQQRKAGED